MNYFKIDRLSFSKLKTFTYLHQYNSLHLWDKLEDKASSKAVERGTIIHRMLDNNDDIELILLELPEINTGKEPKILAQILEDLDNEVNVEALVQRIYNDNYSKLKEDAYKPFFEKIKNYLVQVLECRLDSNKYPVSDVNLFWECINAYNSLISTERDLINADVLSGRNVIQEFSELELLWEYQGVLCKSKLDKVYIVDNGKTLEPIIVDYKIISQSVDTTLKKFNYIGQMAFYRLALEDYLKDKYKERILEPIQCHLLMINPEYNATRIVTLSVADYYNSRYGGFITDRQTIQSYFAKETYSSYYMSDRLVSHYENIDVIDLIKTNNANYYQGINKLVEEYGKFRANNGVLS